ncbi:MAG: aminoacyl-tRNA hydrolase [Sphaerochaetaceae bacterium]
MITGKEALLPLVFGLGNPGKRYGHTRHNVGFDTIQKIAASFGFSLKRRCFRLYKRASVELAGHASTLFVQPLTFMNRSGAIMKYFIPKQFSVDELIVICDTLDLPVGTIRIKKGGSTAGHKGLRSIAQHLESTDFIRIYIGIGRPASGQQVVQYVLEAPTEAQERMMLDESIARAAQATVSLCIGADLQEVMREHNKRVSRSDS